MTKNQIEYAKLKNSQAQLAETQRANRAVESLRGAELVETRRHNLGTEGIQQQDANTRLMSANETQRHNLVTESEATRHNTAQEAISQYDAQSRRIQANESIRHNLAAESLEDARNIEINRHNERQEGIDSYMATAKGSKDLADSAMTNKNIENYWWNKGIDFAAKILPGIVGAIS